MINKFSETYIACANYTNNVTSNQQKIFNNIKHIKLCLIGYSM